MSRKKTESSTSSWSTEKNDKIKVSKGKTMAKVKNKRENHTTKRGTYGYGYGPKDSRDAGRGSIPIVYSNIILKKAY